MEAVGSSLPYCLQITPIGNSLFFTVPFLLISPTSLS